MSRGSADAQPAEEWVLLSDVHLNELVVAEVPGWWAYKAPDAAQDRDLANFLSAIVARRPAHYQRTVLVFNGDTFDFDTCFSGPAGFKTPHDGLPSTEAGSVFKLQKILGDHAEFCTALARFIAAGNRVVFMLGNHDRELHFPAVQEALRLMVCARIPPGAVGAEVAARVSFEPWFLHVPGVLYVEHGNQYDATCSYGDVLDPAVAPDEHHARELEVPFGSLLGRHSLWRLGTFNPYNDESFILSLGGYARHWWHFYVPKHPFIRAYLSAIGRTVAELRSRRRRQLAGAPPPAPEALAERPHYQAFARARGLSDALLRAQLRRTSAPIVDHLRLLLHELWLDRFAILLVAATLITLGLVFARRWYHFIVLVASLPAFLAAFRAMGRGSLALQERARWGIIADSIATDFAVPIVAFGHSHRPERRPLTGGGRYYNLGSWAPVLPEDRGSTLARARRFLVVRPSQDGGVYVAFSRWDGGGGPA